MKTRRVTAIPRFTNIVDLMDHIEIEIAEVKTGDLSESKGRLVVKNRDLQLRGVQLLLQAARLESKLRPAMMERLGLPASGAAGH